MVGSSQRALVKTAVILPPAAASFRQVAGLPLIQRTALSSVRCGFEQIIMMGGRHATVLRGLVDGDARTRRIQVADDLPALDGPVLLIPSDCVLTPATLARVSTAQLDGHPLLFGQHAGHGIGVCRSTALAGIDLRALTAGGTKELWEALRARGAQAVALDGEVCVPVTDERSAAVAEHVLCQAVRAESRATDGPLARRLDRHVSLRVSRWLVRHTTVQPNQITVVGTCVGLLAAVMLGLGTYWTNLCGTLLFLCAVTIDGVDGEVARLTFQESAFGEKFDVITDNIVHVAIFVGLAVGLHRQHPGGPYFFLTVILLVGFACDAALTYFFLVRRPGSVRQPGTPFSLKGKVRHGLLQAFAALMNRDFAYVLVALALVDRLAWFFWSTAFGTYLFAILLVWIYRWRDTA